MGRKKSKKFQQPEGQEGDAKDNSEGEKHAEPVGAVLAVHPNIDAVAIAVGTQLRVLDRRSGTTATLQDNVAPIRALAFDPTGRFLVSGGDDKCFHVWDCATWSCLRTVRAPKKVSAVTFTKDGDAVLAADKFGDVLVAKPDSEAHELLGHYCSIIPSISVSGTGKLVATTDRDHRIRVSVLPPTSTILAGAPEIQAFCFGHTSFASCAAFASSPGQEELLVSGGGDGTLRLWDPLTGGLLDTLTLQGGQVPLEPVIMSLAVSLGGSHVVAVVDACPDLTIAAINWGTKKLEAVTSSRLQGMPAPTDVAVDKEGKVWVAGGPPSQDSLGAFLACGTLSEDGVLRDAPEWLSANQRSELEGRGDEAAGEVPTGLSFVAPYLKKESFLLKRKRETQNGEQEEG